MTSPIAILKPDHLGDLVLSVPAIRAIRANHENVALFVASRSRALARFLFPDIPDLRAADLRHLSRHGEEGTSPAALASELNQFDHVVCLRDDPVMREIMSRLKVSYTIASGSHLVHETAIQKQAVERIVGRYSRTRLFSGVAHAWPDTPMHIALCAAAGFPNNGWPNALWAELAVQLSRKAIRITLIGGPMERDDLHMLSRLLRRGHHDVLIGGTDFAGFLEALDSVDLVVATDGGTAHICSLRKPVCSIFGSSPWRRYAPFGQSNVLITRDELCSPCVQFSSIELNGCVTRECMARISPATVMRALSSNGLDFSAVRGVRVERGISHRYEMNKASPSGTSVFSGLPPALPERVGRRHVGGTPREIDISDRNALSDFMTRSDALGGPDASETIAWWRGVTFTMPDWLRQTALDLHPLSPGYAGLQDLVYGYIAGKPYNDLASERAFFDNELTVSGLPAYPARTPRDLNLDVRAMTKLVDQFDLDGPSTILNLGSRLSFTSEYMARLGHRVVGVHINPDFVKVGTLRSNLNGLGIDYRVGRFGDLPLAASENFDVILSSESFHHCREPFAVLTGLVPRLRKGGQIILAGERFISPSMWPAWGLRLDPQSVYGTAKFGWWESGWTREFMGFLFRGVGLHASFVDNQDDMERYFIGKPSSVFQTEQLAYDIDRLGWRRDRHYLISIGSSSLEFLRPLNGIILSIDNFAPRSFVLQVSSPALNSTLPVVLKSGANRVEIRFDIKPETPVWSVSLTCETWCPHLVVGNGDMSEIAYHLLEVEEIA